MIFRSEPNFSGAGKFGEIGNILRDSGCAFFHCIRNNCEVLHKYIVEVKHVEYSYRYRWEPRPRSKYCAQHCPQRQRCDPDLP
ncbi:hypothetical protein HALO59_40051 [Halomonas sp. 59]|nr:hypothetical protein HALOI3_20199 [Halomonas sp. I3]CAD5275261.1 hypothetical protein HALO113_40200 [Halomonas sp. 113]CAD5276641.1 hypothetical protein HALO156_170058 [Halomonas sp. 156]CAD5277007.1 hypothetical protein HALO59_40051 [Halomonas sp. 59]VXB99650.1 hypothetical protein HALO98_40198 [Halomonas titanicae]